jgi:hypothetical protein
MSSAGNATGRQDRGPSLVKPLCRHPSYRQYNIKCLQPVTLATIVTTTPAIIAYPKQVYMSQECVIHM